MTMIMSLLMIFLMKFRSPVGSILVNHKDIFMTFQTQSQIHMIIVQTTCLQGTLLAIGAGVVIMQEGIIEVTLVGPGKKVHTIIIKRSTTRNPTILHTIQAKLTEVAIEPLVEFEKDLLIANHRITIAFQVNMINTTEENITLPLILTRQDTALIPEVTTAKMMIAVIFVLVWPRTPMAMRVM